MSTTVNFDIVPAKVKCDKCNQEKEIPLEKSLSSFIKLVEDFKKEHLGCV